VLRKEASIDELQRQRMNLRTVHREVEGSGKDARRVLRKAGFRTEDALKEAQAQVEVGASNTQPWFARING
jgi:hypothetical protein